MAIQYKRNEAKIVREFMEYINSTYDAHYATESGRDVIDDWTDMGIEKEAFLSNIIKYQKRFGKKAGYNPKDVIKIMHYCVFLLNSLGYPENSSTEDVDVD